MPSYRAKALAHRPTGNPRGRSKNDDDDLADAVRRVQAVFGVDEEKAVGEVAFSLEKALSIDWVSARKRVRRALKRVRRIRIWPARSRP
jgi:hypothetical protein